MHTNVWSSFSECFPNGTITALAITMESVPSLNPRRLTLRNPACGPTYSNDQYAYFVFTANSCGTTRKVKHAAEQLADCDRFKTEKWLSICLFLVFAQYDAVWEWNLHHRWTWIEKAVTVEGAGFCVSISRLGITKLKVGCIIYYQSCCLKNDMED